MACPGKEPWAGVVQPEGRTTRLSCWEGALRPRTREHCERLPDGRIGVRVKHGEKGSENSAFGAKAEAPAHWGQRPARLRGLGAIGRGLAPSTEAPSESDV